MTTHVSGFAYGRRIPPHILDHQKETYTLGSGYYGELIEVTLDDQGEKLYPSATGRPDIKINGFPFIGSLDVEPIVGRKIEFTNPIHPENTLEAVHTNSGVERE